jgi:Fe-S-cluster containining protein
MQLPKRLALLKRIDQIFRDGVAGQAVACRQHCAVCCTCNVTLTTLEAWRIVNQLAEDQRDRVMARVKTALDRPRFQPTISINHMAQMCVQGMEIPDEAADPGLGDCPLLDGDLCSIYAVRPLACRVMLSTVACRRGGEARIPPFVMTVSQVLLQYLEAVDIPGFSGNLIDMIAFISDPLQQHAYEYERLTSPPHGLTRNRNIPMLMIPAEHRKQIEPLLETIRQALSAAG